MMKILYDHQIFSGQRFGGISRYFFELMKNGEGLYDYDVSGVFSDNEYIRNLSLYRSFPIKRKFRGKIRLVTEVNMIVSVRKIRSGCYDVLHPTYYDPYYMVENDKPVVVTVHDMIHELFPECFRDDKTAQKKRAVIMAADRIIAISNQTKTDILRFYPQLREDRITVVYHGSSCSLLPEASSGARGKYLLFTGQRGGYKNFPRFVEAIAPLLREYDLLLVCTGERFSPEELALLKHLGVSDRISCVFATETELASLYSGALLFVFPSLYEGFGIPILEAFATRCPVALSRASSFPEVAGDAGFYFDPFSVDDMRRVVDSAIASPAARQEKALLGVERIASFSWEKCAQDTAKVYTAALR